MAWKHSQPELRDKAHFPGGRALLHITPFLSYSYKMMICWPSQCGISLESPVGRPAQPLTLNPLIASSCEEVVDRWPRDEGGRGHSHRGSSLCKDQGSSSQALSGGSSNSAARCSHLGGRRTVPRLTFDPQINEQGLWGQNAGICDP